MITDKEFNEQSNAVLGQTDAIFCKMRFDHARYLGGDGTAAMVFAYLLNLLRMKLENAKDNKTLRRNEMWFKCPSRQIEIHLNLWDQKRRRVFTTLIKKNLIAVENRAGNITWLKVNTAMFKTISKWDGNYLKRYGVDGFRKVKPTDQKRGNNCTEQLKQPLPYTKKQKEENEKHGCRTPTPSANGNGVHKKKKNIFSKVNGYSPPEILTLRLYDVLKKNDKIIRRPSFKSWDREFAVLLEERPFDAVIKMIDAHGENIAAEEKYWPQAYSAKKFCTEYPRLEEALARKNNPNGVPKGKKVEDMTDEEFKRWNRGNGFQ